MKYAPIYIFILVLVLTGASFSTSRSYGEQPRPACPETITEESNGIACQAKVGDRIKLSLPKILYRVGDMDIHPGQTIGEWYSVSRGARDHVTVTLETLRAEHVRVYLPGRNKKVLPFTVSITVEK
jgi:hypothetical protein